MVNFLFFFFTGGRARVSCSLGMDTLSVYEETGTDGSRSDGTGEGQAGVLGRWMFRPNER